MKSFRMWTWIFMFISLMSILACATEQVALQAPQPSPSPAPVVTPRPMLQSLTYSEEAGYTRIRLEGSEPIVPPVYQLLSDPSRLVVDLPNLDLRKMKEPLKIDNGTIAEVLVTQFDDKGRIEIYLVQPANYNITRQDRALNIDIEKVKKAAEVKEEKAEKPSIQEKEAEAAPVPVEVKNETPLPPTASKEPPASPESAAHDAKAKEITAITMEKKDGTVIFRLLADGVVGNYDSFKLDSPPRLVVDVWNVGSKSLKKRTKLPNPFIKEIRVGQYNDKLRLVFDVSKEPIPPYQIERSGDQLILSMGDVVPPPTAQIAPEKKPDQGEPSPQPRAEDASKPEKKSVAGQTKPAKARLNTVQGIDFKEMDGKSRLVIRTLEEPELGSSMIQKKTLTVELKNIAVPKHLLRALDTSEFTGAVRSVQVKNVKKGKSQEVLVLVNLKEEVPYETSRDGKEVFIDIEKPKAVETKGVAAPVVAKAEPPAQETVKEEPKKEEVVKEEVRREAQSPAQEAPKEELKKEAVKKEEPKTQEVKREPTPESKKPVQEAAETSSVKRVEEVGLQPKVYSGRKISLDFKDADIKNILRLIAEVSDLNIIAGDDVSGKVTMRLVDVPWDQALDVVLSSRNIGMIQVGNVIRVAPVEVLKREMQSELEAKRSKERLEDLVTEVIPMNYVTAKELIAQVKSILSDRGDVRVIEQTNALLVKDIPRSLERAKVVLRQVDTKTQQVIIEARIVEANMLFQRELGVTWGMQLQAGKATSSQGTLQGGITPGNKVVDMPAIPAVGTAGIIDFLFTSVHALRQLDIQLSAHEHNGDVRIISSPKIATLHNKEASIEQGLRIPYLKLTTEGTVTTDFIEANLKLTVTPHITTDGHVKMLLKVRKDAPDPVITVQGVPSIDKKEAITEVLINDNGMVVIGGIYTINKNNDLEGVPLFSKIPLLGWLFKRTNKTDERKDLLIFVSPRIIKDPV